MLRGSLLFLAFVGLPLGLLLAAPARPARTPEREPEFSRLDFAGSTWRGNFYQDNMWITFEKDGTLTYGSGKAVFKNGSWSLQGTDLYLETNGKYLEFRGTVQGNVLQGEAWNVRGLHWQPRMIRDVATR